VYRLGFASSRDQARQLVRHGHFDVNGRRVNIPSYQLKTDDVVSLRERSSARAVVSSRTRPISRHRSRHGSRPTTTT
jgi:small subunit ribosomal protein S4